MYFPVTPNLITCIRQNDKLKETTLLCKLRIAFGFFFFLEDASEWEKQKASPVPGLAFLMVRLKPIAY